MKVCVVGAGAIGGMMAAKLSRAGHEMSVIARGAHLDAIHTNGLKYIEDGEELVITDIVATSDMTEINGQDLVLLGVKAHQIEPIAGKLMGMLSETGVIVTLQNGIPWWYFQKLPGEYENSIVRTVDPNGAIVGFNGKIFAHNKTQIPLYQSADNGLTWETLDSLPGYPDHRIGNLFVFDGRLFAATSNQFSGQPGGLAGPRYRGHRRRRGRGGRDHPPGW